MIAFLLCAGFTLAYTLSTIVVRVRSFVRKVFPEGRKIPVKVQESIAAVAREVPPGEMTPEVVEIQSESPAGITAEARSTLSELTKIIRTKIARGEITDARAKIIEGLSIDKWHKDLNCLLASLYERDNEYRKAELIYKDLILVHDTDAEIYMKLGFSLSIQGKFEIAYEIYKKLLEQGDGHIEAAEMLANIAHELGRHDAVVLYAKMFLKSYPRNADILTVLAVSQIELALKPEALETLEKLKNLDPYNPRVREMKDKLELELELAKTFVPPVAKNTSVLDLEVPPTLK